MIPSLEFHVPVIPLRYNLLLTPIVRISWILAAAAPAVVTVVKILPYPLGISLIAAP